MVAFEWGDIVLPRLGHHGEVIPVVSEEEISLLA